MSSTFQVLPPPPHPETSFPVHCTAFLCQILIPKKTQPLLSLGGIWLEAGAPQGPGKRDRRLTWENTSAGTW